VNAPRTAVLLDLGDVLVHLRFARGLTRFRQLAGPHHPLLADPTSFYVGPRTWGLGSGEQEPRAFFAELSRELGVELPYAAAAEAWADIFDPWPEMEALAAEVLDAGHPAYLLSNTDPVHFASLQGRMPVLGRLTGLHLSYEVGFNKPDPRFFEGALARFALDPARCVYLDDRPDNVAAAEALGIPGFVFHGDPAEARAQLRERGVAIAGP
jgi:HAD superfamily hydrolase (TIGR01509 family)